MKEIENFLQSWIIDPNEVKPVFFKYLDYLRNRRDIELDFKARPGISYSLRAKNTAQKTRDLFTLIDVVDDEPDSRWLSVCFYASLIDDPEERGDYVPGGLLGEDAICFNLEENDPDMDNYILARLENAADNAKE